MVKDTYHHIISSIVTEIFPEISELGTVAFESTLCGKTVCFTTDELIDTLFSIDYDTLDIL